MTSQPPAQGTPSGLQWFSRPISLARVPEQAADQGSQLVRAYREYAIRASASPALHSVQPEPADSVPCAVQVFASTAERDAQAASCRAKVAGNCLKGARWGCRRRQGRFRRTAGSWARPPGSAS